MKTIIRICRLTLIIVCSCTASINLKAQVTISIQSGPWSSGDTWLGGFVPSDDENVIINSGTTVTLDQDANPSTLAILLSGSLIINTDGIALGKTGYVNSVSVIGTLQIGPNCNTYPSMQVTNMLVPLGGVFVNDAGNAGSIDIKNFTVDNFGIYNHNAIGSSANGATSDFPGSIFRHLSPNSNVTITRWATSAGINVASLPHVSWGNLNINLCVCNCYGPSASWSMGNALDTVMGNLNLMNIGTSGFSITSDMNLMGTLTMIQGSIITGNNEVIIHNTSPGAIIGANSLSYINGNLRRYVVASGSYDFPLGTALYLEKAILDFDAQIGISNVLSSFSAISGTYPDPGTCDINGTGIYDILNAGIWSFSSDAEPAAGVINLTLKENGYSNGSSDPAMYGIINRTDMFSSWQFEGTHDNNTQNENGGVVTAVVSNLSTISRQFGIGIGGFALPVDLLMFSGKPVGNGNLLSWATASEENSEYFDVERSSNGTEFYSIGKVNAAGMSFILMNYEMMDFRPLVGINYYRLKTVDANGDFEYSGILTVKVYIINAPAISLYPNPASDNLNIYVGISEDPFSRIEVKDISGRIVYTERISYIPDPQNILINISQFEKGVYFIGLSNEHGVSGTEQFIKL